MATSTKKKTPARKRRPNRILEFDLPPALIKTISDVVGPGRLGQLSGRERSELQAIAQKTTEAVSELVNPADRPALERTTEDR